VRNPFSRTFGARATAGEEEDKTLGMLLATPVDRIPFLLATTVAMIVHVLTVALLLVAGHAVANPLGDLGITTWGMLGAGLHTAALGILFWVIAVIVGSVSGSRRLTNAATGGMATLAFAMNSFVPLSDSLAGLAKLSPWYYFNSGDPLANGADPASCSSWARPRW